MLNVTCIKIYSVILSVTCHGLRNFPLLIHIPLYPFVNFQNPTSYYFWVRVTHKMLNVTCIQIHSIILSVTCHGLRNFPPLIHIPSRPFVNFWHPISYYFWVRVTHKMLNVTCIKIYSVILSVTCHGLRNFPYLYTSPYIHSLIFETLWFIIFWVRVTCKKLNVTCIQIHSVILSVTCHGLRNFPPLIHIPSRPFMNFQHTISYYFLS